MKAKKLSCCTLLAVIALSSLLVPGSGRAGDWKGAQAQVPTYLSKTGGTLELLLLLQEEPVQISSADGLGEQVRRLQQTQSLSVSIRFDHELDEAEIAALENKGVTFVRLGDEIAHSGTIYGADLPVSLIDGLADRADVLRIESAWQPGLETPLDVSVPEINADDVWLLLDAASRPVTGEGLTIADFDTGIDVFHPVFWNADGGSFSWVDADGDGVFDPGTDAVDLNGNGNADAGETLAFFDGEGDPGDDDGVFQADIDWLYNDADGDGQRDYDQANGFAEGDPTFGEQIFIVDDSNDNNALDVGEDVIALGTSKVLRTLNVGGVDRVRGTDLIQTDDDTNGHGTGVCGILNGGTIGSGRYVGVAPGAELLVANRRENLYTDYMPWARNNGADVMLYEFGGWREYFLDGSSNLEQAIDAEAAGGIVQIVPAGNLAGQDKHAQDDVAAGGNTDFGFTVPSTDDPGTPADEDIDTVYITVLWRTTANNLSFRLTTPTPSVVNLPAAPPAGWQSVNTGDGHTIWYRREDSARGTAKYDIRIGRNDVIQGGWTLRVINGGGAAEHVDLYISDDRTSWSGGAVWTAFQSDENTVTYPATADSAITVASYSTRGWGVPAGELSTFSGRGPRIDGQLIVDVAAPGNYDIASALSKDRDGGQPLGAYRWFSGTSAAGPHVASTSALMLQRYPTLTHDQVKELLQITARSDAFTGVTPNDNWGYGKLNAYAAAHPTGIEVDEDPVVVDESDTATNTGTYSVRPGGTITLDASVGTITDEGGGLWSWSFETTDGPDDSQTVTVTATDDVGYEAEATFELQVNNVAPTVDLASDAPKDEGSSVTVSGTVSDPGWLDPLSATIDWADGSPVEAIAGVVENVKPDATLTFDVSHTYGDDDDYDVEVCASDDATTACQTILLHIDNVPPTLDIDPAQLTEIDEGDVLDVLATFSDPGWLDTYTSSIDWGTGESGPGDVVVTVEGPPADQGQVTGSHQYGDNGPFPVTVTVTDDNGGSGSDSFDLTVHNVDPTAEIDKSGAILINGIPTFLAQIGEPLDFTGWATDPGSDDLFLGWDWDDGSAVVTLADLVHPPDPDPFPSPDVAPRDVTDVRTHTFYGACLYEIGFLVDDDDGGHGEDQAMVVIAGDADKTRPEGYWQHQFSGKGNLDFDPATLECYLAMVSYESTVFDEVRDASTVEQAYEILFLKQNQGSEREQLDRELLTVWLNIANGALEFTDYHEVIAAAESVRLDPNATDREIREQTRILHQINNG